MLCGTALAASDCRRRTVPRRWAAAGIAVQLCCWAAYGFAIQDFRPFCSAALFAAAAAAIQLALALIRPGALGLGDVTAAAVLASGIVTLEGFLCWWLATGVFGLAWLAAWPPIARRAKPAHAKAPFVPPMLAAALAVQLL